MCLLPLAHLQMPLSIVAVNPIVSKMELFMSREPKIKPPFCLSLSQIKITLYSK